MRLERLHVGVLSGITDCFITSFLPSPRWRPSRSRDRSEVAAPAAVPFYLWIPVFSRTTGSVARGDIAGVGLLTVGGFTSGPIYFRASRLAWGLFALGGLRALTLSG